MVLKKHRHMSEIDQANFEKYSKIKLLFFQSVLIPTFRGILTSYMLNKKNNIKKLHRT